MKSVACFGELLLRFSPELNQQWISKANTPLYVGGAELNVATALSKWNVPTKYCTALPDNYLSREIIQELEDRNIDTSSVYFSGNRIGLYYLPGGADLKNAEVIYDRGHSSFASLKSGMIDWDKVFEECDWLHFSAISPALNLNLVAVCKEALEVAKAKKMVISVDLNYREKLWQYGKKPIEIMPELMQHCDVVMGNVWSAQQLLGLQSAINESKGKSKVELVAAAENSMMQLQQQYPNIGVMAYTFRLEEIYFGVLKKGSAITVSKTFSVKHSINKVGGGDCFMSGLIYGLRNHKTPKEVIDFAVAAAIGKLQEKGDSTSNDIDQIQTILNEYE